MEKPCHYIEYIECPKCKMKLKADFLYKKCPRCYEIVKADLCKECAKKCSN